MRELDRIEGQLDRIGALAASDALQERAARVSGWSVAEQLDHVTLVLASGTALLESPGEPPERGINLLGRTLLALGWLPRGVAKSPKGVRPAGADAGEIHERIEQIRSRLGQLRGRRELLEQRRPLFRHPYFGGLTPRQGVRFLAVHTHHHLKIVDDILEAAGRT